MVTESQNVNKKITMRSKCIFSLKGEISLILQLNIEVEGSSISTNSETGRRKIETEFNCNPIIIS